MTVVNCKRKIVSSSTAIILSLAVGMGTAHAAPTQTPSSTDQETISEQAQQLDPELLEVFTFIESIPDSAFENDEAFRQWVEENEPIDWKYAPRVNWLACSAAVGAALVGSLPPAKILKLKSTFKAAGGAIKFFKKFKPVYDSARKAGKSYKDAVGEGAKAAAGPAWPEVQQALLDFFAVGAVAGSCGVGD